jgi:SAM-dependent methyltransferase
MPEMQGPTVPNAVVEQIRRSRRHPRATQFDYLHVRRLVEGLADAVGRLDGEVRDVLDVYCGSRPYDDLLPPGSRIIGLDIDHPHYSYGVADVITDEFLPFPDASFDLVLCTQAFHYVLEPRAAVAEMRRVLRPGGTVLITVPVVWEYDTGTPEHHYTEPVLRRLFDEWDETSVVEGGGWGVSWAAVTATLFHQLEERRAARAILRPLFAALYLGINGVGLLFEALDRRFVRGPMRLPMNLLLTARRPDRDAGP